MLDQNPVDVPAPAPESAAPQTPAAGAPEVDVQRLLARLDQLETQLKDQERRNRSQSDKAFARAMKHIQAVKEVAPAEGWNEEEIRQRSERAVINAFSATATEPEPEPAKTQAQVPPAPSAPVQVPASSTKDLLEQALREQLGLEPGTFDVSEYVGKPYADREWQLDLLAEARMFQKELKAQAVRVRAQNQNAARVAESLDEFGGGEIGGRPSSAYNSIKDVNDPQELYRMAYEQMQATARRRR